MHIEYSEWIIRGPHNGGDAMDYNPFDYRR
jgi:hypothetical protein